MERFPINVHLVTVALQEVVLLILGVGVQGPLLFGSALGLVIWNRGKVNISLNIVKISFHPDPSKNYRMRN